MTALPCLPCPPCLWVATWEPIVPLCHRIHGEPLDLAVSVYRESGSFDVVLDLSSQPLLPMRLAPFGYVHASTAESVAEAIDALSDMQGEFEKPRYFNYNESICAHSRSELEGL